jgi:hypothetical protein
MLDPKNMAEDVDSVMSPVHATQRLHMIRSGTNVRSIERLTNLAAEVLQSACGGNKHRNVKRRRAAWEGMELSCYSRAGR